MKVTADDGTVGWGQSVPIAKWSYETLETATIVLRDYFAPTVIGLEATNMPLLQSALDGVLASGFSIGTARYCGAGLRNSRRMICRGSYKANRWRSCGVRGEPLTLSWTLNPQRIDEVDGLIEAGWERGYRNFNIKVAPDPAFDVELARRVKALVPEGFLWADANGGYDVVTALAVAPKLADAGGCVGGAAKAE